MMICRNGLAGHIEHQLSKKLSVDLSARLNKKVELSDFDLIQELSSGSFGTVSLVKPTKAMTPFVMKMIKKESIIKDKQISHIFNEKEILTMFSDKLKTAIKEPKTDEFGTKLTSSEVKSKPSTNFIVQLFDTFQDPDHIYFLMEYLPGGELAQLFDKHRIHMKIDDIRYYLAEIVLAIQELHNQNVVYRDLKLENIMLDATGHIKLIDFGFAKKLIKDKTYTR